LSRPDGKIILLGRTALGDQIRFNPAASEVVPRRREAASPEPKAAALRYGFRARVLRTGPGM